MKFMRKNGGFTLVELIVVIAILAILAGVAVPAYSGYINKANEAADNQLLAAVNTAFAAACIENGVPLNTVTSASLDLTSNKTVNPESLQPAELREAFARYYQGNSTAAFKAFNGLFFDAATHNFVGSTNTVKITYGGVTISIPQHYVDKLINSTFSDIGPESLLGQVADVSNLALQQLLGNDEGVLGQIVLNPDYANKLAQSLGMADATELETYLADKPNGGADFLANSLVLSTAQNTANMTAEEATNRLNSDSFLKDMTTKLNGTETAQDGLSDAALAYGLYTSYMHKNGQTVAKVEGMEDLKGALEVMKTDEFKTYLNSSEGQADVDAYLSAMKAIDSTTDSPDALKDALNNGFNNEDMLGAFGSLLGGNG